MKKYNLNIYGLREKDDEIEDMKEFLNIVSDKLDINCRFDYIQDFYRFGKRNDEMNRSVSIEAVSYRFKTELLQKAKLLNGTNISIANHYTTEEYRKQKILRQHLIKARKSNHWAFIKKNILVLDGTAYTYEELLHLENLRTQGNQIDTEQRNLLQEPGTSKKPNLQIKNRIEQSDSTNKFKTG